MSPPRRLCVVTGSRADYGLLRPLMRAIAADPALSLQVVATGMHLAPEFGATWREIAADGFAIDRRVDLLVASDESAGMAKSVGLGTIGFADALAGLAPDIVVVLGDRFEMLACAQAAALLGVPLGHISGGEVTTGALDDWIRHCITKMAHLHFVAAEPYRRRVVQLGEDPGRVFNVGDPALDNIRALARCDRAQLARLLGIELGSPLFLVTYHPATRGTMAPAAAMRELVAALGEFPEAGIVVTLPNADAGGRAMAEVAREFAAGLGGRGALFDSLGSARYLAALSACDLVVGNSSSAIVEAPALGKAAVNIGPRQDGRLKARSILDCGESAGEISAAMRHALTPAFQRQAAGAESLYGDSDASVRIKDILKSWAIPATLAKSFHDLAG
jgi:UDP-N-acetylglucosamine 2-epimerase (non-hydrolysing)/GDP/UDP-N,N'-diacetylbacillosamine 2-epimerase (hydrolysing)